MTEADTPTPLTPEDIQKYKETRKKGCFFERENFNKGTLEQKLDMLTTEDLVLIDVSRGFLDYRTGFVQSKDDSKKELLLSQFYKKYRHDPTQGRQLIKYSEIKNIEILPSKAWETQIRDEYLAKTPDSELEDIEYFGKYRKQFEKEYDKEWILYADKKVLFHDKDEKTVMNFADKENIENCLIIPIGIKPKQPKEIWTFHQSNLTF